MIRIIYEASEINVFDINKPSNSFAASLTPGDEDNDYMRKAKNLKGEIVYMTPQEYFELCAKYCFSNSSVEKLKAQRRRDKDTIEWMTNQIQTGKKLPLPYVNITGENYAGQEGLHRMYVCGELYGWNNEEFPVLVIDYADKERAIRDKKAEEQNKARDILNKLIENVLSYNYSNEEEVLSELDYEIEELKEERDINITYTQTGSKIILQCGEVTNYINLNEIEYSEREDSNIDLNDIDIDDIDLDDIDIDELLNSL